jgi:hypothetical protein
MSTDEQNVQCTVNDHLEIAHMICFRDKARA